MMMMFVCAKKTKLKNLTSFRIYVRDSPIITGVNCFVLFFFYEAISRYVLPTLINKKKNKLLYQVVILLYKLI